MVKDLFVSSKKHILKISRIDLLKQEKNTSFKPMGEFILNVLNGNLYEKNLFLKEFNSTGNEPEVILNDLILSNLDMLESIVRITDEDISTTYRTYKLYQK